MINNGEPFRTSEAVGLGLSKKALANALDSGAVRRVVHGVYVDARADDSRLLRARSLALVRPTHTAFCLRTAAWFWGVDCDPLGVPPGDVPLDLVSVSDSRVRRPGVTGRRWDIDVDDLRLDGGILVTSPERTALDCARLLDRGAAIAALDGLAGRALIPGADELLERCERLAGARGIRQARALIPLLDPRAESGMESRTRLAALDAGLPRPECQIEVRVNGELFRLDWGYRAIRVAAEYDGRQFHDERRRAHDERRRSLLRQVGWALVVVDRDRFYDPTLAWLTELGSLIDRRTRGASWSA